MSRMFGLTTAVAVTLALAWPASADGTIRRDVQVQYGDLNINSEAGAGVLLDRLDHAARQACGGSPVFHPLYQQMPAAVTAEFAKCYHVAMQKAVAAVGSPVLTTVYARMGEPSFQRFAKR
ncbi:MAG: UrcA family protein [Alphaproteobacteria bacterium]|nr:UrcA family protein [Alphaproteobacteria bacterium]